MNYRSLHYGISNIICIYAQIFLTLQIEKKSQTDEKHQKYYNICSNIACKQYNHGSIGEYETEWLCADRF